MERSHDKVTRNIQEPVNLYSFEFVDFAKTHFQGGEDMCQFSRAPLQSPLLNIQNQEDRKASSAICIAILRFMSDMSDAKEPSLSNEGNQQLISDRGPTKAYSSGSTFKRRIVSEKTQMASLTSDDVAPIYMMNRPTTNMEKIQFITSYGIRRRSLRDEIYCQICRQLINNGSKTSFTRGWILLALCAGVFSPSDELLNFVRNLMKQGPKGYGDYCYNILQRTLQNDCRRQPPSIVELEAVKSQSPVVVNVTFMDKITKSFSIDPATTCQELCQAIKERMGIKNIFGFSIFIAALDQVANWGCGNESVLDAVSLAEQYVISKGQYSSGAWQLFLRKDVIEPSLRPSDDQVATDLIYHQIIGGIREEEYICIKGTDLVSLVAKRYYIENGPEVEDGVLWQVVEATVPPHVLEHIEQNKFFDKVKDSFVENSFVSERWQPQKVKEDIVCYAKVNWPREFSRIFDAVVISGPRLPRIPVKLVVNSKGFLVVPHGDTEATRLLELTYSQINQVNSIRKGLYLDARLVVDTSSNSYTFRTVHADDLSELLNSMLSLLNNIGPNDAKET